MGKQYGKDKMFDGCADTCWQSKEGKPQSITLEFDRARFRVSGVGCRVYGVGFSPRASRLNSIAPGVGCMDWD